MRIDRVQFFACAYSLAAAGCPERPSGEAVAAPLANAPEPDASKAERANRDARPPAPAAQVAPTCGPSPEAPSSCSSLAPPGPACESFDAVKASCEHLGRHLRAPAAEAVAGCLVARSKTADICWQLRRAGPLADCFMSMLDDVCLDPSVDEACKKAASALPAEAVQHWGGAPHALRECQEVASAVRDVGAATGCLGSSTPEECLGALIFDVDP